ncbi:MAG: 50S ribosomal protein L3 [Chloroflexi bacterium ADurb.Bin325]|nr:MAG: 50S ribosomal protein L3 [Chloroflexi bacterium ADurb.Bin325]
MKGILGRKVGMTQLLTANGIVVPVTVIEAGPCYVTQIKTAARDGYTAIQLGFEEVKPRRLTKGEIGHLRRRGASGQPSGLPMLRILRELRLRDIEHYTVGQKLQADVFAAGERVDVKGISKGRGFQGGVKRHGFRGGPRTHGQSDRLRAPGSSSAGTTPGRIYKGKRMAGHMGAAPVTVANLRVELVDPERNMLAVRGAVPGARGGLVLITEARKQG